MNSTLIQVEFSKQLIFFLKKKGYTHLLEKGVSQTAPDSERDDYVIVPLKNDDARIQYEELNYIVDTIDSNDVLEMASGDEFIKFVVELPINVYQEFKTNKYE